MNTTVFQMNAILTIGRESMTFTFCAEGYIR
jgi:hypothetical protein